jgi:hypothetical protein
MVSESQGSPFIFYLRAAIICILYGLGSTLVIVFKRPGSIQDQLKFFSLSPSILTDWEQSALDYHNYARKMFPGFKGPLTPLEWDPSLAGIAKQQAFLRITPFWSITHGYCRAEPHQKANENLFSYSGSSFAQNPGIMGACSVAGWLSEGFRIVADWHSVGHAMQILSPTATKVGCAYVFDQNGGFYNSDHRFPGCYLVACRFSCHNSVIIILITFLEKKGEYDSSSPTTIPDFNYTTHSLPMDSILLKSC